jgi:hypothetical protein
MRQNPGRHVSSKQRRCQQSAPAASQVSWQDWCGLAFTQPSDSSPKVCKPHLPHPNSSWSGHTRQNPVHIADHIAAGCVCITRRRRLPQQHYLLSKFRTRREDARTQTGCPIPQSKGKFVVVVSAKNPDLQSWALRQGSRAPACQRQHSLRSPYRVELSHTSLAIFINCWKTITFALCCLNRLAQGHSSADIRWRFYLCLFRNETTALAISTTLDPAAGTQRQMLHHLAP